MSIGLYSGVSYVEPLPRLVFESLTGLFLNTGCKLLSCSLLWIFFLSIFTELCFFNPKFDISKNILKVGTAELPTKIRMHITDIVVYVNI